MHRRHFNGARNKFDLNDRVQVRILRKRVKISHRELAAVVRTAGDSIAAVSKEAGDRRRLTLPANTIRQSDLLRP